MEFVDVEPKRAFDVDEVQRDVGRPRVRPIMAQSSPAMFGGERVRRMQGLAHRIAVTVVQHLRDKDLGDTLREIGQLDLDGVHGLGSGPDGHRQVGAAAIQIPKRPHAVRELSFQNVEFHLVSFLVKHVTSFLFVPSLFCQQHRTMLCHWGLGNGQQLPEFTIVFNRGAKGADSGLDIPR